MPLPERVIFPEVEQVTERARKAVHDMLFEPLSGGEDVLFLISGGSALTLLDGLRVVGASRLTLATLDERFSAEPQVNNFLQITQSPFYQEVIPRGAGVIASVPQEGETLEALAGRLDAALRAWRMVHPEGVVVATMGIGPDGHIAGISPLEEGERFQSLFQDPHRWVVGYTGNLQPPERVTVTIPFLTQNIDMAVVYATSSSKQEALTTLKANQAPENQAPVVVLNQMNGNIKLFTDQNI